MTNLSGSRVLIVEDEYALARDLCAYFADMGAVILGPASSVGEAEKYVALADVAVLDIDLRGLKVFPIADDLARRGVPFIFFTGRSDIALPFRFRHAGRLEKPVSHKDILHEFFSTRNDCQLTHTGEDVLGELPKLRLAAMLLMDGPGPADRLVELTLELALATLETRAEHSSLGNWLSGLLQQTYDRSGRRLLV